MISSLEESRGPDAPWGPLAASRIGYGHFFGPRRAKGGDERDSRPAMSAPKPVPERPGLTRRGLVYEYVRAHPGSHVRAMAKELGLATGDLHYHLFWLERHGYVKTKKSGFFRHVFPTMVFSDGQEAVLAVLTQETPREILLYLLSDPSVTQGELAGMLGYSQPTVSWHMDRLLQAGMVTKTRTRRGVVYQVAADRNDILNFVRSYHREVWKRWESRLGGQAVGQGAGLAGEGASPQGARMMPPAVVELIGKR